MPATMERINRQEISKSGIIPEGYQLIRDTFPLKVLDLKKAITESVSGAKVPVMRCTGLFQKADELNANGRIYPYDCLKAAVESIQGAVKNRSVIGEFDHASDAKVHLDRISHIVTKLTMDGRNVMGEIEVINDERCVYGNMLACYLDRGMQVGISSRGVGDMELTMHEGKEAYKVLDGYQIISFDCVAEPSVAGTQLKKQMNESLNRNKISPKMMKEMRERLLVKEIKYFLLG